MAECSISRCSQERRAFRKELQRWGRNVLLLVGYERIAEEVTGRRKWKRLMEPVNKLESSVSEDWRPDETCAFCKARKLNDPAGGSGEKSSSDKCDGDEKANGVIPTVIPDAFVDADEDQVIKVPQIPAKVINVKKTVTIASVSTIASNSIKRSYTEEELQAALRDIQSGKLGTRRAAVIYGIPRSTLRNKVYKLTMGRGRSRQAYANNKITLPTPGTKSPSSSNLVTATTLGELNIPKPILNHQGDKNKPIHSASESLRQLLKHRMAEKAAETKSKADVDKCQQNKNNAKEIIVTTHQADQNRGIAPFLSQVFSNIQNLALVSHQSVKVNSNHTSDSYRDSQLLTNKSEYPLVPLIPDLIHRLAEERIRLECERHKRMVELPTVTKEFILVNTNGVDENASGSINSSVILKIPSYKPHSTKSASSAAVADNVAASSQTCAKNEGSSKHSDDTASSNDVISNGKADYSNDDEDDSSSQKKPRKDDAVGKACSNPDSSGSETSSEKKSDGNSTKQKRPKRGRYRNYNRDSLIEAVRAVQRGEMSVHRAGSFYGVPHSTLEYKVKERHLLRPRKRDKLVPIRPNIAIKKEIDDGGTAEDRHSDVTSQSNENSLTVGSHRNAITVFPSFDFNQLATANQFFASQMMRKLQEDAMVNSTDDDDVKKSQIDSSQNIFSNLIKHSLEQSESS